MDRRTLQVIYNKAGSGSWTKRITIPSKIIADMGITEKDRDIELLYDENKKEITIKKLKKN